MDEKELTPWFVNGEMPKINGVYNVSCKKEDQSGNWFAKFKDGKWASNWRLSVDRANTDDEFDAIQTDSWRGLASDPKKGK
jgi:hypothetical protein